MNTKHTTTLIKALSIGLIFAPVLAQAHPGHSAFDPTAAMPHPGHESEYLVVAALIAIGLSLSARAWLKRRR